MLPCHYFSLATILREKGGVREAFLEEMTFWGQNFPDTASGLGRWGERKPGRGTCQGLKWEAVGVSRALGGHQEKSREVGSS